MKTLYLLRHAKSSWDFPHLSDFERPLNKRGQITAPLMGKRLDDRGVLPDYILSSPAVRAVGTARLVAHEIGYPLDQIGMDEDIFHAGTQMLLHVIRSQNDKHQSLMLVGHNPGFTDLAIKLCGLDTYNIPTAGVCAIGFDCNKWSQITSGELLFYDYPKRKAKK